MNSLFGCVRKSRECESVTYFLWWNIKGNSTKINFRVSVDTWYNKKNTRSTGSASDETTEPEDDRTLVLLDNLSRVMLSEAESGREKDAMRMKGTVTRA